MSAEYKNDKIGKDQDGFIKGKECKDQILNLRVLVKKKNRNVKEERLYGILTDIEKTFDRIDWEAIWDVLRVHGVDGSLLNGVKAFYKDPNVCVPQGDRRSG